MVSTIVGRPGGEELLKQCWDQIEHDCIQLATAMLSKEAEAEAAQRARQQAHTNAPAAAEDEESDEEADPFGAWSPSKRQSVPSADGVVPVTVPERVRGWSN